MMKFNLAVNKPVSKVLVLMATLGVCALLGFFAISNYIAGVLTDRRIAVPKDALSAAVEYYSNSARVSHRLAQAELLSDNRNLALAETHAERAAKLSPWDFNNHLLLAIVKEAKGDRPGAEDSLNQAIKLAPNNAEVHWRMANLLLRRGKLAQAIDEFRKANASDAYYPATFNLVWRASGENLVALKAVVNDSPKAKLSLAQFLLSQSKWLEAGEAFRSVDRRERLESKESPAFLNALIAAGQLELARYLWIDLITGSDAPSKELATPVWNGGFESDIFKDFSQFDWSLSSSDYARVAISAGIANTGNRSLMVDFLGRDTTRLEGQIKQIVFVRPGASYSFECYAKSEKLVTPEGPRLAVARVDTSQLIAESEPFAAGSTEWQKIKVDFVAPEDAAALMITVKRVPKFKYDDPTRGRVWFDDFTLTERKEVK